MDKYEYRIRAEEINSLIEQQEYAEAVKIADTIDWRRVRSVVMLCKVSELYKMNRRYEDSKEVLLLAYDLQPGSRKIIYSLCELSIKLEETVQAVEYYKEFVQVAPRDTGRFILQYRLYEAQDVSLEERIAVLEEYKKRDYREKWAYELAYLYHRIGLATRCVEECDELILWFGEGKYVLKAMELKMLHAPLSPQQQEKYNARFLSEMEAIAAVEEEESRAQEEIAPSMPIEIKSINATNAKTAKIPAKEIKQETEPDLGDTKEFAHGMTEEELRREQELLQMEALVDEIGDPDASAAEEDVEEANADGSEEVISDTQEVQNAAQDEDADMKIVNSMDDLDIHVKTIDVGDQYSTINLQEALAKDLAELFAQEDMGASDATRALPIDSLAEASQFLQKETESTADKEVSADSMPANVAEKDSEPVECEESESGERLEENPELGENPETATEPDSGEIQENVAESDSEYAEENTQESDSIDTDNVHNTENEAEEGTEPILMESQDLDDLTQLLPPMDLSIGEVTETPEINITESEVSDSVQTEGNTEPVMEEMTAPDDVEISEGEVVVEVEEYPETEEESAKAGAEASATEAETESEPQKELEPLIFSNQTPLPDALIQAMQTVAIEAARQAAVEAAKEAAKETASAIQAMQPEFKKEADPATTESDQPGMQEEQKEEEQVEKQITGQLSFSDIMDEWEKTKKANEEKHLAEMKQRVLEQTGPIFSDFDSMTMGGSQDELNMLSPMLDVFSETEELAEQVQQALDEDLMEASEIPEVKQPNGTLAANEDSLQDLQHIQPDSEPAAESLPDYEEQKIAETEADETEEAPDRAIETTTESAAETENEAVSETELQTESEEEIEKLSEAGETEEAPAEEDETVDRVSSFNTAEINGLEEKLMSALSNQHYETSNLQVEALSEELSAESAKADNVSADYKETEEGQEPEGEIAGATEADRSQEMRHFTKVEKEIFGSIAPTKELQQSFAAFLDHISMNPLSGNVILTGENGVGTLQVAQNIAGYLAGERSSFTGNIETFTFEDLKEKDIIATFDHLKNGAMIIDRAGDLSQQACITLTKAMKNMTDGGIVVILTDTQQDIERLQRSFTGLSEFFTNTFTITTLDNDGLVNFGKEYAKQQEYSIDDMGVLALYNRIEELQTIDHAVTIDEVKEIVNEAIRHADKKNVAHFMDVIFAKRYDKDDMIVLREKDFLTDKKEK